jgi:hypothetical protein
MLHIVRTRPNEQPVEECQFSKMSFELLSVFHAMNSDERTRALQFAKDIVASKVTAA